MLVKAATGRPPSVFIIVLLVKAFSNNECIEYGPGHECAAVLLPGFVIS